MVRVALACVDFKPVRASSIDEQRLWGLARMRCVVVGRGWPRVRDRGCGGVPGGRCATAFLKNIHVMMDFLRGRARRPAVEGEAPSRRAHPDGGRG